MKLSDYIKAKLDGNQAAFARIVGVSEITVSRWCRGLRIPSHGMIPKILSATDGRVRPEDFYDLTEENSEAV